MTVILGIESSCDDTSAAILKDGLVLSNVIASQMKLMAELSLNWPHGHTSKI